MLKLFQTEADIMLGKKNLVSEFYDELVCELALFLPADVYIKEMMSCVYL